MHLDFKFFFFFLKWIVYNQKMMAKEGLTKEPHSDEEPATKSLHKIGT